MDKLDAFARRIDALEEDYEKLYLASRRKRAELENGIHDLGNLLGLITPYLYMLHDGEYGPVNDEQREALAYLIAKTDELDQMARELLASAHPIDIEPHSLAEVAQAALRDAAAAAEQAGVHLVADFPNDLPLAQGDAGQLRRVFDNLLGNAIAFSSKGSKVTVRIRRAGSDCQRVEVQDHGPGIAPKHHKRVWNRFYRIDTEPSTHMGSGLGLAIVKEIVEAHGGQVRLESAPGEGSTFSFTVPAEDEGE